MCCWAIRPRPRFRIRSASAVAVVTSLIMFLSGVRHLLMGNQRRYDLFMLLMDSAGLGIFTVMGVRVAWHCVEAPSLYLLVFVGVLTGVGGGLLRDVMAGDMPYIFVKHIYACASLVGAVLCGRAAAAGGGDAGHAGRRGGGVCHPVPVGPLPVESAPSQRLKKRRNFPDMAWNFL